jgi:non-specific serine/threonine protein kinase
MSKSVDSAASELTITSAVAKAAEMEVPGAHHVLQLLGSFEERGPNGTHLVLVYPAMGGTVASMVENLPQNREARKRRTRVPLRYPKWMAKRILKHTLLGLVFLHGQGIVHGDLQSGNLLFSTRPLDGLNEVDLTQDMVATTMPLTRRDGRTDLWAPRYLVLGQQLYEFAHLEEDINTKISDLGAGKPSSNMARN